MKMCFPFLPDLDHNSFESRLRNHESQIGSTPAHVFQPIGTVHTRCEFRVDLIRLAVISHVVLQRS